MLSLKVAANVVKVTPLHAVLHLTILNDCLVDLQRTATLMLEDTFQEVVYWQVVARGCAGQTIAGDIALTYPHAPPTV